MRLIALIGLVAVSFFLAPSRARAEIPPEFLGRPIASIEIEIDADASARRTLTPRELGVPIGAIFDRALLRDTIERLLDTGRWADIQLLYQPVDDGIGLIARLVPRRHVARIDIIGNKKLSDEEIQRTTLFFEDDDFDEARLAQLRGQILHQYQSLGYDDADVKIETRITDTPGAEVVRVLIEEKEPTRIATIIVEGDPLPPALRSKRVLGFKEGDTVDLAHIESSIKEAEIEARERGYLTAKFELARILRDPPKAAVYLKVRLGDRYDILIRGNGPITRDEILDALAPTDDPLSAAVLLAMEQRVIDRFHRSGYPDAKVKLRRVRIDEEHARIIVDIDRGRPRQKVAISFPGAEHFSEKVLQNQIESYVEEATATRLLADPVSPRSLANLLEGRERPNYDESEERLPHPRDVLYRPAYQEAIEHIQELYAAAGFGRAVVGPVQFEEVDDGVHVVIPVDEGPRTHLFRLSIEGNELFTTAEVAELLDLEAGMPFSRGIFEAARKRLVDAYAERGYLFALVEGSIALSEDETRANLDIVIRERFAVRVGGIEIHGAERTRTSLIRDLILLEVGEAYRPSVARRTQERLMALGVFRSVAISIKDPELPERVKIVEVNVAEHKNQFLDVRGGISTAEGIRTGFEYGIRNTGGRAIALSLHVQLAAQFLFLNEQRKANLESLPVRDRLERWIGFGLMFPEFAKLPYVRTSLNVMHVRDNELTFGLDQNRFDLTITRRKTRTHSLFFTPAVENNRIQIFDPDNEYQDLLESEQVQTNPRLQRLLRVPEGQTNLMALKTGATIDLRDNVFNPRRGFHGVATVEWARTFLSSPVVRPDGSEDRFFSHHLSVSLRGTGYIPIKERVVFALQGQYGRVIALSKDSETYPNRRFFMGGVDTMRAFHQDAMTPQDVAEVAAELGDEVSHVVNQGGNTYLLLRGELRFPIYSSIAGGIFTEFGNLWSDPTALNPLKLRPSIGLGIRLETPIGPIALDYGFNILYNQPSRRVLRESFGAFSFTIGLF
ncbi:MAG: BamA/TamA family outer membrane protein [Sandaracinaceae bacterium]|nr:BamA/TamA family outer membrane protein [Sandaracinaceae bacterium]